MIRKQQYIEIQFKQTQLSSLPVTQHATRLPPITISYYRIVQGEGKHLLLPVGVFRPSVMQTAVILHHTLSFNTLISVTFSSSALGSAAWSTPHLLSIQSQLSV